MSSLDPALATIDELTQLGNAHKQGTRRLSRRPPSAASKLFSQLMLPIETMLLQQWAQTTHQAVLHLGLHFHLFEALLADNGSPKTSAAIAERKKPRAETTLISRMLRHLAAMGTILEIKIDTFAPTPLAKSLVDERFRDTIYFITDDVQPVHQAAPAYFAEPGYEAPGSSVDTIWQYAHDVKGLHMFEHFERVPLMGKRFAGMMDPWSEGRPKWFQEGYYPCGGELVEGAKKSAQGEGKEVFLVDVGAGSGHDLQQLREAFGEEYQGELVLQAGRRLWGWRGWMMGL